MWVYTVTMPHSLRLNRHARRTEVSKVRRALRAKYSRACIAMADVLTPERKRDYVRPTFTASLRGARA